ncbi:fungal-specific transcription factor domain-containing protein [Penicillium daleae]|uniref:Fungal-specific transcription factor domain-containing protein n=1 Tax=Penicillium daleae TaxID=63821 RepID=A0AAD6G8X2_9EURO|nr:fungal-specific transcription factor domain-containing protein [Penicillium daleae]KAJ5464802.1 fungal-specific transcription factor domain-containing protein [Penicillium daleae]
MKPGPKIGSSQKRRKCRPLNETTQSRWISSSSLSKGPGTDPRNGDFDSLDGGLEKEELVHAAPADPTETPSGEEQQASQLNTLDLAFILHPSHEVTTPDETQKESPNSQDGGHTGLYRQACKLLGVSQAAVNQIIRIFFENMVAINIFHEPSFAEKLSNISSLSQLTAILAAIAAYASRFDAPKPTDIARDTAQPTTTSHQQPAYFIDLAFEYINKALVECDDEMPPLCVLQALIVATHCRLSQGVRGKAWRSLGLCVSLIYETNLHLLDSRTALNTKNIHQWQDDEEKRRAFWAIWEMDVFASTIRRTPTAIDWNRMEILLPVDNTQWFSGQPTSSCFMERDPNQRWKTLQDSGSQSPKAWFLVINSLMKDAQIVCDPQEVLGGRHYYQPNPNQQLPTAESAVEARQKLETLANAVRCFSLALPGQIHYRDQYLAFGTPVQGEVESQRQQHCSIYNIFVMTQLARLMIYRYDAFRSQSRQSEVNGHQRSGDATGRGTFSPHGVGGALQQYYEAADGILRIVNRSCEEHIWHINPFLSSTIWLASAVQLVRKHFARLPSNRNLIKSRFDVLYLTYKRCIHFWDTQTALQRNLESIVEQLEAKHNDPDAGDWPHFQETPKRALEDNAGISHSSSDRNIEHIRPRAKRPGKTRQKPSHPKKEGHFPQPPSTGKLKVISPAQYLSDAPIVPLDNPALIHDGPDMTAQSYTQRQPATAGSMATLDFMSLQQPDRNQTSEDCVMHTDSNTLNSIYLSDIQHNQALDSLSFDFPNGIYDLLAGWTSY